MVARWLVLCGLLWGCGDDATGAARAPAGGGSGVDRPRPGTPPTADDDAGSEAARDAGVGDAGVAPLPSECRNVEDIAFMGEDMPTMQRLNAVSAPADMELGRLVTAWAQSCEDPAMRLTLSNGSCPDGGGHEITFTFPLSRVQDGTIGLGQNFLFPRSEETGIDVRYVRPESLSPSGQWGNCAGAEGIVDLVGEVNLERGRRLQGRFLLTNLTACDGSGNAPMEVNGDFNGLIRRNLQDVCP